MNDLESRLASLRPAPAPPALWDRIRAASRARGPRRPWLLAAVSAAAAGLLIAVLALPVVPPVAVPAGDAAAEFARVVDRVTKAKTLAILFDADLRLKGAILEVKRDGHVYFQEPDLLNVGFRERRTVGGREVETQILVISDGKRLYQSMIVDKKVIPPQWRDAPADLGLKLKRWLLAAGNLNPFQVVLDLPVHDLPLVAGEAPEWLNKKGFSAEASGIQLQFWCNPLTGLPGRRVIRSPELGTCTEMFLSFGVDVPVAPATFEFPPELGGKPQDK